MLVPVSLQKKVKHPGYKGDPFFELAIKQEVPKFERKLEQKIKRVKWLFANYTFLYAL